MGEALDVAQKLSTIGFPSLLLLILFGSYAGVWVWGRAHRELKADYESRLAKAEASTQRWQDMALSAVGLAETSVNVRRGVER